MPQSNAQVTLELRHFINEGVCLFDPVDKYPIWNEDHRAELEKKIVEHYALRQIGFETFGQFKYHLNVRMREIMPYYNELYKTTLYKYNPIHNYDMEEEFDEDSDSSSNSKAKLEERFSDTPQGKIENLDDYLSTATRNNNDIDNKSNQKTKNKGWRKGNIGVTSTQQLIQSERDIIINIDMLIIDNLKDLFLGVY